MTNAQRIAHGVIVVGLGTGFLAALYMVFVVYHVEGHSGPLMGAASGVPHEFLVERRLYALEAWVTFGFLSIYLALTWIAPRRRDTRRSATKPADEASAG